MTTEIEPIGDTPQIVLSIVGSLGDPSKGDPQVSVHTSVPRDHPNGLLNETSDRLYDTFKRLAARAEVERIDEHIAACQRTIEDTEAGESHRTSEFNDKVNALEESVKDLTAEAEAGLKAQQEDWSARGKTAAFRANEAQTTAYGAAKKKLKDARFAITNARLEAGQARQAIDQVIDNQKVQIKRAQERRAKLQAVIDGG